MTKEDEETVEGLIDMAAGFYGVRSDPILVCATFADFDKYDASPEGRQVAAALAEGIVKEPQYLEVAESWLKARREQFAFDNMRSSTQAAQRSAMWTMWAAIAAAVAAIAGLVQVTLTAWPTTPAPAQLSAPPVPEQPTSAP